MTVSGLLLLATIVVTVPYGGWTGLAVVAVATLLVRAWVLSRGIAVVVSGLLLLAILLFSAWLYGGWINVAVMAVVAVLVLAWARSRNKPPPGPDGAQRKTGSPAATAPPGASGGLRELTQPGPVKTHPARASQHGPVPLLFEDDHQSVPANRPAPRSASLQGSLMDRPQHPGCRIRRRAAAPCSRRPPARALTCRKRIPNRYLGIAATGPAAAWDPRPLLVIVDGQGRLTRHAWLREQPFWRDVLVLCAAAAPAGQRDRLRRHRAGHAALGAGWIWHALA